MKRAQRSRLRPVVACFCLLPRKVHVCCLQSGSVRAFRANLAMGALPSACDEYRVVADSASVCDGSPPSEPALVTDPDFSVFGTTLFCSWQSFLTTFLLCFVVACVLYQCTGFAAEGLPRPPLWRPECELYGGDRRSIQEAAVVAHAEREAAACEEACKAQ